LSSFKQNQRNFTDVNATDRYFADSSSSIINKLSKFLEKITNREEGKQCEHGEILSKEYNSLRNLINLINNEIYYMTDSNGLLAQVNIFKNSYLYTYIIANRHIT